MKKSSSTSAQNRSSADFQLPRTCPHFQTQTPCPQTKNHWKSTVASRPFWICSLVSFTFFVYKFPESLFIFLGIRLNRVGCQFRVPRENAFVHQLTFHTFFQAGKRWIVVQIREPYLWLFRRIFLGLLKKCLFKFINKGLEFAFFLLDWFRRFFFVFVFIFLFVTCAGALTSSNSLISLMMGSSSFLMMSPS